VRWATSAINVLCVGADARWGLGRVGKKLLTMVPSPLSKRRFRRPSPTDGAPRHLELARAGIHGCVTIVHPGAAAPAASPTTRTNTNRITQLRLFLILPLLRITSSEHSYTRSHPTASEGERIYHKIFLETNDQIMDTAPLNGGGRWHPPVLEGSCAGLETN